ncbi:MAG: hypothetical protein JW798_14015, partial [Prolixibacteraceae bacterium]|nr:hypothetical protein [Prolixibacteraceae bacterium]
MKKYYIILVLIFSLFACKSNKTQPEDMRIENLLSQMTLREKVAQLNLITALDDFNKPKDDVIEKVKNGEVGHILKSNGVKTNRQIQEIAVNES